MNGVTIMRTGRLSIKNFMLADESKTQRDHVVFTKPLESSDKFIL
jgi:hypothetical protein